MILVFMALLVVAVFGNCLLIAVALSAKKNTNSTGIYLLFLGILNLLYAIQLLVGLIHLLGRGLVLGERVCQLSALMLYPVRMSALPYFCIIFDLLLYVFCPTKYSQVKAKYSALVVCVLTLLSVVPYVIIVMSVDAVHVPNYIFVPENRTFSFCERWDVVDTSDQVVLAIGFLGKYTPIAISSLLVLASMVAYIIALTKVCLLRRRRRKVQQELKQGVLRINGFEAFYISVDKQLRILKSLGAIFVVQMMSSCLTFLLRGAYGFQSGRVFWSDVTNNVILNLTVDGTLLVLATNKNFRQKTWNLLKCACSADVHKRTQVVDESQGKGVTSDVCRKPLIASEEERLPTSKEDLPVPSRSQSVKGNVKRNKIVPEMIATP